MNGGYYMTNAAGLDLKASGGVTIKGLHQALYNGMSLNKPMILYNVLNGEDTELLTPLGCACTLSGSTINVYTYIGISFTVTDADLVTINE